MRNRHFAAKLFHLPARTNFTEESSRKAAQEKRYCEFVKNQTIK